MPSPSLPAKARLKPKEAFPGVGAYPKQGPAGITRQRSRQGLVGLTCRPASSRIRRASRLTESQPSTTKPPVMPAAPKRLCFNRVPTKGGFARSCRLRRGQEDQGSQAAHPGRHDGPPAERCRSLRRHSGPRWRRRSAPPRAATDIARKALNHGFVHQDWLAEFRSTMHDAMPNRDKVDVLRLPQPGSCDIDCR